MTDEQLKNSLAARVNQYDDPEHIFKGSVDEFMHMYSLSHDAAKLIKYMLKVEFAPGREEAVDYAKEFLTAESVLFEMDCYLVLMCEIGLIQKNDNS